MPINNVKLATATAICMAALWLACSVTLMLAPKALLYVSGAMMHMDLSAMGWAWRIDTLLVGLVAWSLISWVTVWLTATLYQRLIK